MKRTASGGGHRPVRRGSLVSRLNARQPPRATSRAALPPPPRGGFESASRRSRAAPPTYLRALGVGLSGTFRSPSPASCSPVLGAAVGLAVVDNFLRGLARRGRRRAAAGAAFFWYAVIARLCRRRGRCSRSWVFIEQGFSPSGRAGRCSGGFNLPAAAPVSGARPLLIGLIAYSARVPARSCARESSVDAAGRRGARLGWAGATLRYVERHRGPRAPGCSPPYLNLIKNSCSPWRRLPGLARSRAPPSTRQGRRSKASRSSWPCTSRSASISALMNWCAA